MVAPIKINRSMPDGNNEVGTPGNVVLSIEFWR